MPAYFGVYFELEKGKGAISAFCKPLIRSGFAFKSGYWGFENDSFDDIIAWNQDKLDSNFELGYTEHHSHGYKQMLFDYSSFTEVRLFILNNPEKHTFSYSLIVPENDLVDFTRESDGTYSIERRTEKMAQLVSVAKKMWAYTDIVSVQTGWECSDFPPSADEIANGIQPQAEPFCIINSDLFKKAGLPAACECIERNGVLFEAPENWKYL